MSCMEIEIPADTPTQRLFADPSLQLAWEKALRKAETEHEADYIHAYRSSDREISIADFRAYLQEYSP